MSFLQSSLIIKSTICSVWPELIILGFEQPPTRTPLKHKQHSPKWDFDSEVEDYAGNSHSISSLISTHRGAFLAPRNNNSARRAPHASSRGARCTGLHVFRPSQKPAFLQANVYAHPTSIRIHCLRPILYSGSPSRTFSSTTPKLASLGIPHSSFFARCIRALESFQNAAGTTGKHAITIKTLFKKR